MKSLITLLDDVRNVTSSTAELRRRALDCVQLLRKICPEYSELTDDFFSQIDSE